MTNLVKPAGTFWAVDHAQGQKDSRECSHAKHCTPPANPPHPNQGLSLNSSRKYTYEIQLVTLDLTFSSYNFTFPDGTFFLEDILHGQFMTYTRNIEETQPFILRKRKIQPKPLSVQYQAGLPPKGRPAIRANRIPMQINS